MIRLEGVTKRFRSAAGERTALDGVDLEIAAGEVFGVVGRSGAGKSTLVRTINRLERPDAGRVFVDGEEITALDAAGLRAARRRIGMIFQHFNLLNAKTIAENVAFPLRLEGRCGAEVDRRVAGALAAVGVADLADRPTHLLSFGQRKRVAIAGALAVRPRLLVLDEPTAGLDPAGVEELVATLHRLHDDGTGVVLSTHDVDLAHRWADDVAVVAGGRIRTGSAPEVLGDPGLLAGARLGPAWAPAVARLLGELGRTGPPPRTAAELHALLDRSPARRV